MTQQTTVNHAALAGAVPLDLLFDADRMAAEVQALDDLPWRLNRPLSQGGLGPEEDFDWRIISLRGPGGDPLRTDPGGPGLEEHADTPFLARCPYHAEVLAAIPAPLRSARLMALGAGAHIHEHCDGKLSYPWGTMRLHVPVITNPGAMITVDAREYHWEAGRLWFADFDRLHQVRNTGRERRVHLVIDCMPTRALLALFPADYLRQIPWRDVLFARDPVPLQAYELEAFRCRFLMPARFPEWSDEPVAGEADNLPAAINVDGGSLVLEVDGTPMFRLVHLGSGEFRLLGWTEERTLHIDLTSRHPVVRFWTRSGHGRFEWTRPVIT
jgi:hypothetical protein